jgi:hypothetical protein
MDSKALRVIKEIQTALEVISIANGYQTDAGLRVSRGRKRISRDETFPLISIHEGEEEVVKSVGVSVVQLRLPVTVEGFVESDLANPLDSAHPLLADIKKSLFPALIQNRGSIINVNYLGRVIDPPEDGSRYSSVSVHLAVEWGEELSNPY